MLRRLAPGLALCSLLLPGPARAQALVTLSQAVSDTLANNPSLVRARASVQEAEATRREARANYFPHLVFSEAWQRSDQPVFAFGALLSSRQFTQADFAVDRLNSPGATSLFTGRIGVHQLIFDGGGSRAGVEAASRSRDAVQAGADAVAADLALAATRAYGKVLSADAAHRAAATAVTSADEDVHRAERRRDAGTATEADVLAMSVHAADMRQREIQAAGDAAIARAELNRLMGAAIDRTYQVEEPPAPEAMAADVAALSAEGERSRPELIRATAERASAEAALKQARAVWYPAVSVDAGYQGDGLSFADRAGSWMVAGEVRWALSLGGAESARVAAAEAVRASTRASETDARAAIHVDVFAALKRLEAARARLATGVTAVSQARESQRILRNRFDAGLAGVNDVLRAATAELDAEAQRVAALVDAITARAEVMRALGRSAQ